MGLLYKKNGFQKFLSAFNGIVIAANIYEIVFFTIAFLDDSKIISFINKLLFNNGYFLNSGSVLIILHGLMAIQIVMMVGVFIFQFKKLRIYGQYYFGAFFSIFLFAVLYTVAISYLLLVNY